MVRTGETVRSLHPILVFSLSTMPEPPTPPTHQPSPRGSRTLLHVAAGLALLLAAVAVLIYVVFVLVPRETVETGRQAGRGAVDVAREGADALFDVGEDLARRLADGLGVTPKITVRSDVLVEQSRDVLELATVERSVRVDHAYVHTWLASTKELRLRGDFRIKAGFDLSEGFEIHLDEMPEDDAPRITVRLPEPQILSVEMLDLRVEEDEGFWNRIQPAERQQSIRDLQRLARREAQRAGILEQAQAAFERQIQQAILEQWAPTRFEFGSEPTPEMRLP